MQVQESIEMLMHDVNNGQTLSIAAPYFSYDVLKELQKRGAFTKNQYNQFDTNKDVKFLCTMRENQTNGVAISEAQSKKVYAILAGIKRFLSGSGKSDDSPIAGQMAAPWAIQDIAVSVENVTEAAKREPHVYTEEELKSLWGNFKKYMSLKDLTDEQQKLIALAKEGKNVLVDACIGSGKTTTIQVLCSEMKDKQILYLTYNALLKRDAKEKIRNSNVFVTNYHGFAYKMVKEAKAVSGRGDCIQVFNQIHPHIPHFDLLVLDEYQDIEQEIAEELEYIKACNPGIQIIAVGDLDQKIYDKTTLDVVPFMDSFLGTYEVLQFTTCFRLCEDFAERLGNSWDRNIVGVNSEQKVEYIHCEDIVPYIAQYEPKDLLCLGAKTGEMSETLNALEQWYPEKFNKKTVYASIRDEDRSIVYPDANTAIFTTFDSSKGLERRVCIVFDYNHGYWDVRNKQVDANPKILKNIFLVAASRGKERIVFVLPKRVNGKKSYDQLQPEETKVAIAGTKNYVRPFNFSDMFDHKYKEDVEACYKLLKIKPIELLRREIDVEGHDCLIDLSHCIGIWQEASFFNNYDIDKQIEYCLLMNSLRGRFVRPIKKHPTLDEKILYCSYAETGQDRFVTQVKSERFLTDKEKTQIHNRLSTVFAGDEAVQGRCEIKFWDTSGTMHYIEGSYDVFKNDRIYELKFVTELEHVHFLQLAGYLMATNVRKGILWNVRTNEMFEVSVPKKNQQAFMDAVINCITKGRIKEFIASGEDTGAAKFKRSKKAAEKAKKLDSIMGKSFKSTASDDELDDELTTTLEDIIRNELRSKPAEVSSDTVYDTSHPDWKDFEAILEP